MKLSANALDVFGMRPTSLRHEFRIRSSRCETLRNDGLQRNRNILAHETEAWNENECQTTRMDLVCALPHFRMYFEFIRVGKKLSSTMGWNGHYTLVHSKSSHELKLSSKCIEWTSYAAMLTLAHTLYPSLLVRIFPA